MPDIAMCQNKECPSRKECYRYMAIPCEMQYYADFEFDKEKGFCNEFMAIHKGQRIRKNED